MNKWLIWSIEHNGWWAPNERGYVEDVKKAGRYELLRVLEILQSANIGTELDGKYRPNEAMVADREEYN